jgi:hypothetical protein
MLNKEIIENIFAANEEFHKEMSREPVEIKIKKLIELQKIAINIKKSTGRPLSEIERVWKI